MSNIIQKWIATRLGVVFDINAWDEIKGALLLAQLLHSYDLISQTQLNNIRNGEKVSTTVEYMRSVITNLGIELSASDFDAILHGNELTATKLYYHLYLALHDKSKIHYAAQKKINALVPPNQSESRFKIEHIEDNHKAKISKCCNPLAYPLVANNHIISWHKVRYEQLLENCKNSREKYTEYMRIRFGEKIKKLSLTAQGNECLEKIKLKIPDDIQLLDLTFEELLIEQKKIQAMESCKPDFKVAKKIFNTIKKKRRKQEIRTNSKAYFQKMLLRELWEKIINEQEENFKNVISLKMVKQSMYEQQMAQKMFEVREQKKLILENRAKMLQTMQEARDKHCEEEMEIQEKQEFDAKVQYYNEKERNKELHRRLYVEKLRRKSEKHHDICEKAMKDIVDISLFNIEYADNYDMVLPKRKRQDLANLFIKEQPIFDIMEDVDDVIQYEPNKYPDDIENIYTAELNRQNTMDEMSFEAYDNLHWPWLLNRDEVDMHPIDLGMNVLGFIVHRLLLCKYPKQNPPPPPVLPKIDVAVCVNGLNNLEYLPPLQRLLQARGIQIIQVEDAINYCLKVFKEETTTEYMDSAFIVDTAEVLEPDKANKSDKSNKGKETNKGKKPDKKGAKGSTKNKGKVIVEVVEDVQHTSFADKTQQTPKKFPCEEMVLSPAGKFGDLAYEILNLGGTLNDQITSSIIVEYLKAMNNIKGWVLINYPQTVDQAAIFEEKLTSIPVPIITNTLNRTDSMSDIVEFNDRLIYRNTDAYPHLESSRYSSLLPNPDPVVIPDYETYLTAFIEVKSLDGHNLAEEYYERFKQSDTDSHLNQFYMDQGCKYTLYYKAIDYPTVKHLAKLIIGDYSIPLKTSLELFTDTVDYVEADIAIIEGGGSSAQKDGEKQTPKKSVDKKKPVKAEKASEEKKSKKEGKEKEKKSDSKKGGKEKKSDSKKGGKDKKKEGKISIAKDNIGLITHEDEETQFPEPGPELEELFVSSEKEPRAGEKGWSYIKLPISETFIIALASLWENTEETYISDFQQLFFRNRVLQDTLVPYLSFIYKNMTDYISRPDDKQIHLHAFQTLYNEFDEDLRQDEEVKAEIHCRISEFREKLWAICDHRMRESEAERRRIIEENWITYLTNEMTNVFIGFLQLELNRCSDTLHLIIDYYSSIVTKMPNEELPLECFDLEFVRVTTPDKETENFEMKKYIGFVDEYFKMTKKPEVSPFEDMVIKNWTACKKYISVYNTKAMEILTNMTSIFTPKGGKGKGKNNKSPKSPKTSDKRNVKTKVLPKFVEPEPEVKDQAATIIEEFTCALEGEILRAQMRIDLIKDTVSNDINDVLNKSAGIFHKIYSEIGERYKREIRSVLNACEIFARAVEAEVKLQPEIILDGDKLIIDPTTLLFDDNLPNTAVSLGCKEDCENFTVIQLDQLIMILSNIAPGGQIPERSFVFLLQDILVKDTEDGQRPMVPHLWSQLEPHQTSKLSSQIFGDTEYIDWKDFIIYNLNLRYPSEEELLQARIYFRQNDPDMTEMVQDYQFYDTVLWFEDEFSVIIAEDVDKLKLIKKLLFRLFKVSGERINYTALLLYFCKDEQPVHGFIKALELSMGKLICWDMERGEQFRAIVVEKRLNEELNLLKIEADKKDTELMAQEQVLDMIDATIHTTESVIIEDYEDACEVKVPSTNFETQLDFDEDFDIVFEKNTPVVESDVNADRDDEFLKSAYNVIEMEDIDSEQSSLTIFSNVEIGFEAADAQLLYYLPFDVVINILGAVLPWQSRTQNIGELSVRELVAYIYEKLLAPPYVQFKGMVMAHALLNDMDFINVLAKIYKFQTKYPRELVKVLVDK